MIPVPVSRRRIFGTAALPIAVVVLFAVLLVSAARRITATNQALEPARAVQTHLDQLIAELTIAAHATTRTAFSRDTGALQEFNSAARAVSEHLGHLDTIAVTAVSRRSLRAFKRDVNARLAVLQWAATFARAGQWPECSAMLQKLPDPLSSALLGRARQIERRETAVAQSRWRSGVETDRAVVVFMILTALLSIGASFSSGLWLIGQVSSLKNLSADLARKSAALSERSRLLEQSNRQLQETADSFAQQKQATDQARQHAREVLFSMTPAMMVLDGRWRIKSVTAQAAEMLRRLNDELRGQIIWNALPELGATFEHEVLRSATAQIPLYFEEHIGMWDMWIEFRTLPIGDGIAVFLKDTTAAHRQRQVREDLLRRIEHAATEWQQLFDAMDVPILVLDGQGRIQRVNEVARRLAGLDFSRLIGGNVRDIGNDVLWRTAAQMAADAKPEVLRREVRARDSLSGRTWEISATWFPQPENSEPRVIVKARDVTELIALEYSLAMADKLSTIGMVTAGVAHEVRNPLFSISALVDAMDSSFPDRSELRPYMDRLRRQVDRMRDLMTDLLEYGKASAPDTARGDVRAVIATAVLNGCFARDRVRIRTVDGTLPEISMDAKRLELVFRNLIENAVQHSNEEDPVEVSVALATTYSKRWLECSVEDRGPGFAPADLPHVFEPFFTRRKGGTGLGLSIVQRIVHEHGGSIHASNRARGGACVTVRLPLPDVERAASPVEEAAYASI